MTRVVVLLTWLLAVVAQGAGLPTPQRLASPSGLAIAATTIEPGLVVARVAPDRPITGLASGPAVRVVPLAPPPVRPRADQAIAVERRPVSGAARLLPARAPPSALTC